MSLLEKTKEELVEMLSVSHYINDEFLKLMHKSAKLFDIDIKDPFSEEVSVQDFITEYKNTMTTLSQEYNSMKNNSIENN